MNAKLSMISAVALATAMFWGIGCSSDDDTDDTDVGSASAAQTCSLDGAYMCDGNTLMRCTSGSFVMIEECGANECEAEHGHCHEEGDHDHDHDDHDDDDDHDHDHDHDHGEHGE
ncbi:MAG: hypothetical protein AAGA56_01005 [Myxococcota bacterium]